jgi:hypothetical protein
MTEVAEESTTETHSFNMDKGKLVLYWTVVLIPLAYGIYNTLTDSVSLFTG